MARKDDGGPAFPLVVPETWLEFDYGITAREYFAAHAPPIPDWWPPSQFRYVPVGDHGWTGEKREAWLGYGDYLDDKDINPEWVDEFKAFRAKTIANSEEQARLCLQAELERLVAWQLAYADAMIEARAK